MVDSINGLNGVNEIKTPELKATAANDQKLGGFGFGFPENEGVGTRVEKRIIPGLDELENKFAGVKFQTYKKNVAQLEISDEDFKSMNDYYPNEQLCEV
ncbi:MAG: hypothetical protein ACI37Q_02100 [Candidatus Gastranaerophilaceae bacterium]